MNKYRKIPVEIEAIQFKRDCFEDIREFANGRAINFRTERCVNGKSYCEIETLEGVMTATEGDYIIKGIDGEFYPCKPDIFKKTYEKMDKNKSKYMTITVKCEDLDCVKNAITIINNCIYEECGIISEYNLELLNALLGENWDKNYDIGSRYIEI